MYKINFLEKINKQKLERERKEKKVYSIFTISLIGGSILIVVILLRSLMLNSNIGNIDEKRAYFKSVSEKITKRKDYVNIETIKLVEKALDNKVMWSSLFNVIEKKINDVDKMIIVNNISYEENILNIRFNIRSNENNYDIMAKASVLRDSLNNSPYFKKYLKANFTMQNNPEIDNTVESGNGQVWFFEMFGEFKPITKTKSTESRSGNRSSRF